MATVNLGRIKFVWQGAYSGATAYVADDVVSYNGSSYICILASTGNLPTNATYWQQMSSAGTNGTNGTDLTTTLTTQGDIVYRNASGLARLGAGTNGQVLTTAGAGANPSWSTVSSDFVKLGSATLSSAAATLSIDGFYDDTIYSYYKLHWKIRPNSTTSNNHLFGRVNVGGSSNSATQYTGAYNHFGNNSGGAFNDTRQFSLASNWSKYDGMQMTNTWGEHDNLAANAWNRAEMTIWEPQSTSNFKQMIWVNSGGTNNSDYTFGGVAHGIYHVTSSVVTGFTFSYQGGANLASGSSIILYGVKK